MSRYSPGLNSIHDQILFGVQRAGGLIRITTAGSGPAPWRSQSAVSGPRKVLAPFSDHVGISAWPIISSWMQASLQAAITVDSSMVGSHDIVENSIFKEQFPGPQRRNRQRWGGLFHFGAPS